MAHHDYDTVAELIRRVREFGVPNRWIREITAPADDAPEITVGITPWAVNYTETKHGTGADCGMLVRAYTGGVPSYSTSERRVSPDALEDTVTRVVERLRRSRGTARPTPLIEVGQTRDAADRASTEQSQVTRSTGSRKSGAAGSRPPAWPGASGSAGNVSSPTRDARR